MVQVNARNMIGIKWPVPDGMELAGSVPYTFAGPEHGIARPDGGQ